MPIELKGSCHCGAVRFTVQSSTPVPYQLCVCSICRKVGGAGGSINLGAHSDTLKILQGKEHISVYNAVFNRDTPEQRTSEGERSFCSKCSSMLWNYNKKWPEYIHPFASVIDSPELPPPESMVIVRADSKPEWVRLPEGKKQVNQVYGSDSIEGWHKKHNLWVE
ncbi:hypothetical protein GYMLUDRAFT_47120 [Collybiopsis luxurians FD-317 M1]|uniref:CENP-V/GFA domain-containing protein n=1 Tax=Collybiopsis luxurians FD-317 M1 TaxID=944289 RepID=A0A0D0B010_9AGAR|nr:hypothetical protein GYMLUDRAFT_47120 [Collybiopsis luxurians FD-317 M1]